MRLFGRAWALEVGTEASLTRYEHGRMRFAVRMARGSVGTCRVTYSNPPRSMVGKLADAGVVVRVLAGWEEGGPVEVFRGSVQPKSVEYRQAGDPEVSMLLSASRTELRRPVARWVPGPCTLAQVVDLVRQDLGLAAGDIDAAALGAVTVARGYAAAGMPATVLREIADSAGLEFIVEAGRLSMWRRRGAATTVDIWRADSWLLDVTTPAGDGEVKARALLRSQIRPGSRVRIESAQHRGDLAVREVAHLGDTHGQDWTTTIVGVPVA